MSKHIGSVKLTVKQFSAVFRSVENHSVRWLRVKKYATAWHWVNGIVAALFNDIIMNVGSHCYILRGSLQ